MMVATAGLGTSPIDGGDSGRDELGFRIGEERKEKMKQDLVQVFILLPSIVSASGIRLWWPGRGASSTLRCRPEARGGR
jgi:hypothetical protein